jgi:hypothetical protein
MKVAVRRWVSLRLSGLVVAAALSATAGLVTIGLRPGGASAAGGDAGSCSALSNAAVAKDLGQRNAMLTSSSSVASGSGSGEVSAVCRYVAWTGSVPTSPAQAVAKEKSGDGATLAVTDQLLDSGDQNALQEPWAISGYTHYRNAAIVGTSSAAHGHHFPAPSDGASTALGYQVAKGGVRELVGIWSNASDYALITITITVGKPKSGVSELKKIAASAVPAGI